MRILVIGGTAFMGPQAVHRLVELGHEVTVLHRGETEAELPAAVRHIHADRQRPGTLAAAVRAARPEAVLDMLALTDTDAHDLVAAVAGRAERLVVASSIDVYRTYGKFYGSESGPPEPMPLTEGSPLRSVWYPYRTDPPRPLDAPDRWMDGYDKIPIEVAVLATRGLRSTMIRLPMVYGPHDRQRRLRQYLARMDRGRPAILLDEAVAGWRGARGYVEDMGDVLARCLLDERAGPIYHVAEMPTLTELAWVEAIAAAAGWQGRIVAAPTGALPEHLRAAGHSQHQLAVDSTRIRRDLGYAEAISRDEALRRTIAWEREQPAGDPARIAAEDAAEDEALARIGP